MTTLSEVWDSASEDVWVQALKKYWECVMPPNLALEREMDQLDTEAVRRMDAQEWYDFLLMKYFRWKFTAPNRYASTTKSLKAFAQPPFLSMLYSFKERLFLLDKEDIKKCLTVATAIPGLGPAGGSGLLAILFPKDFGTADQFVVNALREIPDLPEQDAVSGIRNPESLKPDEGTLLIGIMRRKASELNTLLGTTKWTPRKIDMILWAFGHRSSTKCSQ